MYIVPKYMLRVDFILIEADSSVWVQSRTHMNSKIHPMLLCKRKMWRSLF